jgi:hypothetical protein
MKNCCKRLIQPAGDDKSQATLPQLDQATGLLNSSQNYALVSIHTFSLPALADIATLHESSRIFPEVDSFRLTSQHIPHALAGRAPPAKYQVG